MLEGVLGAVDWLRFRAGDCAILALRLRQLTGFPLVGLFEGTELHHVAVLAPDGRVLDADGLATATERAKKFVGNQWKRITAREVARAGLPVWVNYDAEELAEVDAVATRLLAENVSNGPLGGVDVQLKLKRVAPGFYTVTARGVEWEVFFVPGDGDAGFWTWKKASAREGADSFRTKADAVEALREWLAFEE